MAIISKWICSRRANEHFSSLHFVRIMDESSGNNKMKQKLTDYRLNNFFWTTSYFSPYPFTRFQWRRKRKQIKDCDEELIGCIFSCDEALADFREIKNKF